VNREERVAKEWGLTTFNAAKSRASGVDDIDWLVRVVRAARKASEIFYREGGWAEDEWPEQNELRTLLSETPQKEEE
jgi:hypothetical protein